MTGVIDPGAAQEFLSELAVGVVTCRLYSVDHPRAERARQRIAERCDELLGAAAIGPGGSAVTSLDLAVVEDEIFLGDRTFTREGEEMAVLVRCLHHHGVDQVSFEIGVTREEIGAFATFLAGPQRPQPPRLPHVRIRRPVPAAEAAAEAGAEEIGDLDLDQRLEAVAGLVSAVVSEAPPPMALIYGMVQQLDERLQRSSSPLRFLAELADERDWTVIHAHNTAVLALMLAIPIMDDASARHDLGAAAVLHDVGKFGMPPEVVQHDLGLSGLEWELNYDHPRIGLELLLAMPRAPAVAQVVAFDHHITQSGGGYPTLPKPRPPHPAAAIVSLAEVVDIMSTVRLARGQTTSGEIVDILRGGAGDIFEPALAKTMAAIWEVAH